MPNFRDDFSSSVKNALEQRVGSVCSKPGCGQLTRGPKIGVADKTVNIGQAGHISAASEGGARYDSGMTAEERKAFANGIWLCLPCHKIVDSDSSPYDVNALQNWKRDAEERARKAIEHGEARMAFPSLVSVLHKSMENIPDGALRSSMPAIFDTSGNLEVVIDSCDLYAAGAMSDPREAMHRQVSKRDELNLVLGQYPRVELAYYGIAHIPLAFHFGYLMSTKVAPHFAEKDRTTHAWRWLTMETVQVVPISHAPAGDWRSYEDAVVRIGVSYPVLAEQTDLIVQTPATFELGIDRPAPDKITSRREVEAIAAKFREVLDVITTGTRMKRIHVFASVPMCVAFALGQQISASIHPQVIVYNYRQQDMPQYKWGLRMTDDIPTADAVVINS